MICSAHLERIFKTLTDRGEQNGSFETIWMSGCSEVGVKGTEAYSVRQHAAQCSEEPVFSVQNSVCVSPGL